MIRHIVFFSARHKEDVEAVRRGLLALGNIPHSRLFEVTLNTKVDPLSDEIDVVVYAEFEDDAALAAYKAHPLYAETTSQVKPLRELRYSADVVAAKRN
ncbi:MAG: Dabb family protein [Mesorhizobium sp.]|uniref:Dabb family protein n=1 Tax=Mesorhizobium sp. TaxID=1871066 RepID=UPI000FE85648|nr:Dabb family protein [Mesorhizobium sp.]RWL17113.1 MAG: Dabb family protein [Mesorhizobium sp.]